ncbi:GntR family transcriptional regulator [Alloyangia pacifica]|uniref:DNA-binding transcriptional regulator, GntR family n=1 Tax=Alloyangia pacifica TaxID=311180 RepID=A0A1I6UUY4_9RHOB|nr:GntR family transcriptional regulator [Alloyangia pacifica]SDI53968.1 DNA-binding transcriptional regulator, GntR family [Alloyangia pacifica]SFT05167.1 DNA-binding transcriptional regulator, GntR family [Alloyangia pacifica]
MQPLKKRTFREQIVEELKNSILNGSLPLGSPVVEAELAKQFGVSRGPLREALRHLIEEGFLITIPYTGTRVATLSLDDVREVFSLRAELEVFAFKLIWNTRDEDFRNALQQLHTDLKQSIEKGDEDAAIAIELSLHSLVYERCGHKLLLQTWQSLKAKLQLYWVTHHRVHGRRGPRIDAHEAYVSLALGDDFDALAEEVRAHILNGFARTEAFLVAREQASSGQQAS